MEKTQLLLEYLKEQYTQGRQHETLQTNATTFLTAAAGVVLGLMFKDGLPRPEVWWMGLIVALVGLANWRINRAHYIGNRYRTDLAGMTRRALEDAIMGWTPAPSDKPTDLRKAALEKNKLRGKDISVGKTVYNTLRLVPFGVIVLGVAVAVVARGDVLPANWFHPG